MMTLLLWSFEEKKNTDVKLMDMTPSTSKDRVINKSIIIICMNYGFNQAACVL